MSLLAAIAGSLGPSYDPAAVALFLRMSPAIAADEKEVYNTAILALKAAGIWSTLDCMGSFYAPHSQAALLNWTENDHNVTAVNSPTFTAKSGYATNGTTQYLEIDYIPATDAVNFAQNSGTIACEVIGGTDAADNAVNIMGVNDGGTRQIRLIPWRSTDNAIGLQINQNAASICGSTVASRLGLFSASRTASNAVAAYRNGSSIGTDTDASTGLPQTYKVWIGGYNNAGSLTGPAANTFAGWAIASQWDATKHASFYTIMSAFRTAMALT